MVDQALEAIIKNYLCASSSPEDALIVGPNAPLSTFSSRIEICYRLSLISARLCRDLHIIRKIRNEFAHNITGCNFETPKVRNRILELLRSTNIDRNIPDLRKLYGINSKGDFQLIVSLLLTHLWIVAEDVNQLNTKVDESIYSIKFWE